MGFMLSILNEIHSKQSYNQTVKSSNYYITKFVDLIDKQA